MGLGILGRGIGDTMFLAKNGANLLVTDKKTKDELKTATDKLREFKNIKYRLGEHALSDFKDKDLVFKAAGVPLDSEYIKHASKNNSSVVMSAALVVKLIKENFGDDVCVIGITGTRGKSTTTNLIAGAISGLGKKVHLGGNVRGVSNLPLLSKIKKGDFLVMELDSWQLQGFGDLKISPDISVFTSFLDDHMNYYKGDVEQYFIDKAKIFLNQNNPVLIASKQAEREIHKRFPKQKIINDSSAKFIDDIKTNFYGEHNKENIRLAVTVLFRLGFSKAEIIKVIKKEKPPEGRLEYLGKIKGINVFDDNNATSPDAVIAAVSALESAFPNKKIHLVAGGAEKNSKLQTLIKFIKNKRPELYLLNGTGTQRFLSEGRFKKDSYLLFDSFQDSLKTAFEKAKKGEIIILSPGFASFGMFKNEYDREDQFKKFVNKNK